MNTVVRIVVEAHDVTCDPLITLIDKQVSVRLELLPLPLTPIEDAIEQSRNGHSDVPTPIPSNVRRRRGTHADPTEDE